MSTPGNDAVQGSSRNDTLYGFQGNDIIFGNGGDDVVLGNAGVDTLYGGTGSDTLYGGQGNDILNGEEGNDVLSGDLGADRFVFGTNAGSDIIVGFDQTQGDSIDLQGQSYTRGQSFTGNALLILSGGGTVEIVGYAPSQINASIFAFGGPDFITGSAGNDTILGLRGDDTIVGAGGDDLVYGLQDNDLLYGNTGSDTLLGGQGDDTLFGGQGYDTLFGGQGDDVLSGDRGDDVLSGDLGADRYVFGLDGGRDVILGFDATAGDRIDLQGQTYTLGTAAGGSALLTLSGGGTVEIAGVTPGQVNAGAFV
ncbi:calcium-binding protein [Methylobacterium trifolii]|uniref:Alginate lyase 7 n=1 Tax=Methylobacterium trifolii TaxID=1003092 RepID=A0ABQ4TW06_9HYPH|nr:calcium-binding protein [Methylobacterium trifolii]GJE58872.1 Alginate lyase 7 [Methylobacterium trifolii]